MPGEAKLYDLAKVLRSKNAGPFELTLDILPEDLLAQVDPRQVVADATRLPEDVVSWERYVAEEVAR